MLSGVWAARLFSLPLLLEVNAPLAEERGKFGGLAMPAFARWTEEVAWRNATYVLPVTAVLGGTIQKAGVAASRILVTSNGVDTDAFHLVDAAARPHLKASVRRGRACSSTSRNASVSTPLDVTTMREEGTPAF